MDRVDQHRKKILIISGLGMNIGLFLVHFTLDKGYRNKVF